MDNINEYIDVKSSCVDPSEVEGAILENFGEPSSYVPRVTGTARGGASGPHQRLRSVHCEDSVPGDGDRLRQRVGRHV
jgi:hypothetical protein